MTAVSKRTHSVLPGWVAIRGFNRYEINQELGLIRCRVAVARLLPKDFVKICRYRGVIPFVRLLGDDDRYHRVYLHDLLRGAHRQARGTPPEVIERVLDDRKNGFLLKQIAHRNKLNVATVCKICRRAGMRRENQPAGDQQ